MSAELIDDVGRGRGLRLDRLALRVEQVDGDATLVDGFGAADGGPLHLANDVDLRLHQHPALAGLADRFRAQHSSRAAQQDRTRRCHLPRPCCRAPRSTSRRHCRAAAPPSDALPSPRPPESITSGRSSPPQAATHPTALAITQAAQPPGPQGLHSPLHHVSQTYCVLPAGHNCHPLPTRFVTSPPSSLHHSSLDRFIAPARRTIMTNAGPPTSVHSGRRAAVQPTWPLTSIAVGGRPAVWRFHMTR